MNALFLVLVAAHLLHSLVSNREEGDPAHKPQTRMSAITQVPMFLVAFVYGAQHGMLSRELVSPLHIAYGLLAGHVIFALSLLVTHQSVQDAWSQLVDVKGLCKFGIEAPYVLSRFMGVAIAEEIIWRVALQPILVDVTGSVIAGITIAALGFAIIHHHFFKNTMVVSLEFTAFALLLGGLYYWTGSLILVIVIHAVRDIEIAHLEYQIKVEEYGDAAKAEKELAALYMPRRRLERL